MANPHFSEFENRQTDLLEQIVIELKSLNERSRTMTQEFNDLTAAVGKISGDVTNVRTAIAALKQQISDLQNAGGATPEQLAALTTQLEAADAEFDLEAPDPAPADGG